MLSAAAFSSSSSIFLFLNNFNIERICSVVIPLIISLPLDALFLELWFRGLRPKEIRVEA